MSSVYGSGILFFTSILVYVTYRQVVPRRALPEPPGPRRLPVLGNLFQIPFKNTWVWCGTEFKKKYGQLWDCVSVVITPVIFITGRLVYVGDVSSLSVLGQRLIILNSLDAIEELFQKRSAIYSDRPQRPLAGQM